jgi:hypothetical protein
LLDRDKVKIAPSQISQDFYHRLEWCNFGWDFTCLPISEQRTFPSISRDNPPSDWQKTLGALGHGPRELTSAHIGPLPIPNLETLRGIPSAIWYTLGNVFSASWLAKLVFAMGLTMAVLVFIGAKESRSFWHISLCIVFFPVLVSLCAWLFILLLQVTLYVTSGIVFLLILAFGILSWVMWIKDVWEARREILKGIGRQPQKALAEGTAK